MGSTDEEKAVRYVVVPIIEDAELYNDVISVVVRDLSYRAKSRTLAPVQ